MIRALAVVALVAACAPVEGETPTFATLTFATPRALLTCEQAPDDLAARLWVSGSDSPCELAVDVDVGSTSGTCDTRPGVVRTLTLDWFAQRNGIDLVLAQARGTIDLTASDAAEAEFAVADEDIVTADCVDATFDQVDGAPTILVNGADVPVCDVDESCGGADGSCSNLGEVCAATDPFDPGDDP